MKVNSVMLEVNGSPVANVTTADIKKAVVTDLKNSGLKESSFDSVDIYINVESGSATAHYVAGEHKGSVGLGK